MIYLFFERHFTCFKKALYVYTCTLCHHLRYTLAILNFFKDFFGFILFALAIPNHLAKLKALFTPITYWYFVDVSGDELQISGWGRDHWLRESRDRSIPSLTSPHHPPPLTPVTPTTHPHPHHLSQSQGPSVLALFNVNIVPIYFDTFDFPALASPSHFVTFVRPIIHLYNLLWRLLFRLCFSFAR